MGHRRLGLDDLADGLARRDEAEREAARKEREKALAEKICARLPGAEVRLVERTHDVSIVVDLDGRRLIGAGATIDEACQQVLVSASRPRPRTPRRR